MDTVDKYEWFKELHKDEKDKIRTALLAYTKEQKTPKKEIEQGRKTIAEKDYDKIIFSSHFRRLQDKTQVYPLSENDFVHTRLTHSMEVSCVGRSLGRLIGAELDARQLAPVEGITYKELIADVVAAACLAHDIGNPPFGHQGEQAFRSWWRRWSQIHSNRSNIQNKKDFEYFEGNAFGFRVLHNLKVSPLTLATYTKYPCSATNQGPFKKNGLYSDDLSKFGQIADKMHLAQKDGGPWQRHPFAFLVEAADDICYHIMDLEDAVRLGIISATEAVDAYTSLFPETDMQSKFNKSIADEAEDTSEAASEDASEDAPKKRKIQTEGFNQSKKQNTGKANYESQSQGEENKNQPNIDDMKRVKDERARIIGTAISRAKKGWFQNISAIFAGDFNKSLTDAFDFERKIDPLLKRYWAHPSILKIEAAGYKIIGDLMDVFVNAAVTQFDIKEATKNLPDEEQKAKKKELANENDPFLLHCWKLFPQSYQQALDDSQSIYQVILLCADYVSGMTDTYATNLHKEVMGQRRVH